MERTSSSELKKNKMIKNTQKKQKENIKKKRKKVYGKNKFIRSEVKGDKFWNYEHKVYKANSKKPNTTVTYGKAL